MPELPEIEVIKLSLKPIIGKKIISVKKNRPDLRYPIAANLETTIQNQTIINLRRRSRYLIMDLSNDFSLIWHLGMSGKILLRTSSFFNKHDHVIIELSNQYQLIFNDPRRFGMVDLLESKKVLISRWLANIGPEPLSQEFNAEYLYQILLKKHSPIKNTLMSNDIVAGIGNIYANEILFSSRIHPSRLSCSLSKEEVAKLVNSAKKILVKSIKLGGSSLKDFIDSIGRKGDFQNHFLVYGGNKRPCVVCGNEIVKTRQAGRATYFCVTCQFGDS